MTEQYLFQVRSRLPLARRHPFLFVDVRAGRPISASAVAKVFNQLAEALNMRTRFSPHVLRHTWNDDFSRHMDATHVSEEREQSMRNHLQGWEPASQTAQTYTRRHIRERAFAALQDLNAKLIPRDEEP
jgi:integrase